MREQVGTELRGVSRPRGVFVCLQPGVVSWYLVPLKVSGNCAL